MSSTEQQTEVVPVPVGPPALFWVAIYLMKLVWGGYDGKYGYYYEQAILVADAGIYVRLGVPPACCFTEAEAETVASRMRSGLNVLNEGRFPLRSTLSQGLYDVRVVEGATLPSCFEEGRSPDE